MTLALALLGLTLSSTPSFAVDWVCEIVASDVLYEGKGRSLNAAKVDMRHKCLAAGNKEMFCGMDEGVCATLPDQALIYCELVANEKVYFDFNCDRRVAMEKIRAACLAEQRPMFCTIDNARCFTL